MQVEEEVAGHEDEEDGREAEGYLMKRRFAVDYAVSINGCAVLVDDMYVHQYHKHCIE